MTFVLEIAESITADLDAIIKDICPSAGRRSMYGGTVFELEPGNHQTLVCGHFVYKQHVSLELSNGTSLDDPNGILEGQGKYRRHIKFTQQADVADKGAREFLEQAFRMAQQS